MFNNFYNFKTNPFSETPNTSYFFKSKDHTLALRTLANMIDIGQGLSVLTGEVGTGKTLLCRVFLKICNANFNTGLILHPKLKSMDLLRVINDELGVPKDNKNRSYFHQKKQLSKHLQQLARQGQRSLLIIDEAQHMTEEGLESLSLLNNLEYESKKILHIILAGQPELQKIISSPGLEQLRHRIANRVNIESMASDEVSDYIHHRLFVSGGSSYIRFDSAAVELISKQSSNIPRLINIICQHAIEIGEHTQTRVINESIVKIALKKHPLLTAERPSHWMTKVLPL